MNMYRAVFARVLKSKTKKHAFDDSGRGKVGREATQVLKGGESLALESTVLYFIPGIIDQL